MQSRDNWYGSIARAMVLIFLLRRSGRSEVEYKNFLAKAVDATLLLAYMRGIHLVYVLPMSRQSAD